LRPYTRTSFHHQPEAQHPKSSAIHKLPADYPIFWDQSGHGAERRPLASTVCFHVAVARNMAQWLLDFQPGTAFPSGKIGGSRFL
jgi:hypothetical protein